MSQLITMSELEPLNEGELPRVALEIPTSRAYRQGMDTPSPHPQPAPSEWLDAMDEADADLKAGRTVDSAAVMRGLDEAIAELQAKIAGASR